MPNPFSEVLEHEVLPEESYPILKHQYKERNKDGGKNNYLLIS